MIKIYIERVALFSITMLSACGHGATCKTDTAETPPHSCEYPLWRSDYIYRAILDDLIKTYDWVGGGGIDRIQETAVDTYAVYLPQEERVDVITYVVAVDDRCKVRIVRRSESVLDTEAQPSSAPAPSPLDSR